MLDIQRAQEADVPEIIERWAEMMRYHADLDERFELSDKAEASFETYVRSLLTDEARLILVAKDDGVLVGYVSAQIKVHPPVFRKPSHGEITELAVAEKYRGGGIGGRLVAEVRRWLRGQGVDRVEVTAATRNERAISFWTSQGFESYFTVMAADVRPAAKRKTERH